MLIEHFNKWIYGEDIAIDNPVTIELIDYILKKEHDINCSKQKVVSNEDKLHTYENLAARISEYKKECNKREKPGKIV